MVAQRRMCHWGDVCIIFFCPSEWLLLARQTAAKVQLSIIHKIAHTSALITYTPRVPVGLYFASDRFHSAVSY